MPLPSDYAERVYAGVLGKIIGVYLGRPFEGWTYDRIMAELGEITYYVHAQLKKPLIVTDDDIAGTFTFLRALEDHLEDFADGRRAGRDLTPIEIGQTWLNYLIEQQSILWWGGLGNSTEHTAYLRLKQGTPAPQSGSIALNGKTVAEQIGAQIFIDGWAMVAPGDPELAASLARRAASVSHDGEAIYGAQVLAAMEAQAFIEPDLNKLIDTAIRLIPTDSVIYRLIADLRSWRAAHADWRKTRELVARHYGYDTYIGNCHMVPNHAVIMLGLLYGNNDFQTSLMITNTSGWDTDCNSGNVGCLMGIKNGLAGIDAGPDWRGPVADRLYLAAADGGRAISDAVSETYHIVNMGRSLAGEGPLAPKNGARFHFDLPGAVQGFQPEDSMETRGTITIESVPGHSAAGSRSLALRYRKLSAGRAARVATPTFVPPDALDMPGYSLNASPTLYPGQTMRAALSADTGNGGPVTVGFYLRAYKENDRLLRVHGPQVVCAPGEAHTLSWTIGDMDGSPIAEAGIEITSERFAEGTVYLDYLTWEGAPDVAFKRPVEGGTAWRRAWINAASAFGQTAANPYRVIQNQGRGMVMQGTRTWKDYRFSASVTPHLIAAGGIAGRVQGLRRYYALLLCQGGTVRLVKMLNTEVTLAEAPLAWQLDQAYALSLEVTGNHLKGWVDGRLLFEVEDASQPLAGGAVALVVEEGSLSASAVSVNRVG